MKKNIYITCLTFLSLFFNAQEKMVTFPKGQMITFWGWNRAIYTNSDIHFKGTNYDFILKNVKASDRPLPFTIEDYFYPQNATLPQTNAKIGYFYKDNEAIILALDHMKYVMDLNQKVEINGQLNNPYYSTLIENGQIDLSSGEFLEFEHTDGLNYINIGWEKYKDLYQTKNTSVVWSWGGGLGALLPKTNATLMQNERSDRFHLAGFGLDARSSLNLVLWKHLLIRLEAKAGYINMPDIKTTLNNKPDKASQDFGFGQLNFGIGYTFNVNKKKEIKE